MKKLILSLFGSYVFVYLLKGTQLALCHSTFCLRAYLKKNLQKQAFRDIKQDAFWRPAAKRSFCGWRPPVHCKNSASAVYVSQQIAFSLPTRCLKSGSENAPFTRGSCLCLTRLSLLKWWIPNKQRRPRDMLRKHWREPYASFLRNSAGSGTELFFLYYCCDMRSSSGKRWRVQHLSASSIPGIIVAGFVALQAIYQCRRLAQFYVSFLVLAAAIILSSCLPTVSYFWGQF